MVLSRALQNQIEFTFGAQYRNNSVSITPRASLIKLRYHITLYQVPGT